MRTVVGPIEHIAVPLILLGLLAAVFVFSGRLPAGRRGAGYTGLWLGIVVCVIYVLVAAKLESGLVVHLGRWLKHPWAWGLVLGATAGVVVPVLFKRDREARIRPILLGLVSTVTSVSAVNLFFSPPIKDLTVYGAPAALFGCLVLGLLPASVWERKDSGPADSIPAVGSGDAR